MNFKFLKSKNKKRVFKMGELITALIAMQGNIENQLRILRRENQKLKNINIKLDNLLRETYV